jgi:hypothetical protein
MHSRYSLSLIVWCAAVVWAGALPRAFAQDIFVTPIPNVPFSAVVNVERSAVESNGSVVVTKTIRDIHRDSQGRIYNESREFVPVTSAKMPNVERIHLYDPKTRVSTMIDMQGRTFWTRTLNRPPETVPPALTASPSGNTLPQNEFTTKEDLGMHEIDGVLAHGVRETQTIQSHGSGEKELVIADEYWYSDELRINLMIQHNDPRKETVKLTVSQVTRAEPDPAVFEVPRGYQQQK